MNSALFKLSHFRQMDMVLAVAIFDYQTLKLVLSV